MAKNPVARGFDQLNFLDFEVGAIPINMSSMQ
jgi:hypothetical protein